MKKNGQLVADQKENSIATQPFFSQLIRPSTTRVNLPTLQPADQSILSSNPGFDVLLAAAAIYSQPVQQTQSSPETPYSPCYYDPNCTPAGFYCGSY